MLGVEALPSSSEKVKTCQEVKEVSSRKIFTNEEQLGERSFLLAEDEVKDCSFLVEG